MARERDIAVNDTKRWFYRPWETRIAWDVDGNPEYVGKAAPGTASSESFWQIKKITWDANGNPTLVEFANDSSEFLFEWDERTTYFS